MHLITIKGRNRAGHEVTYVLGEDRDKRATVSGISIDGDGTVIEEAEFLDAKVKRYFERGLTSRMMRFTAGRQFNAPQFAINFVREHRRGVPVQGDVVWTVTTGSGVTRVEIRQACLLIPRLAVFGLRVETDYQLFFGDFEPATTQR